MANSLNAPSIRELLRDIFVLRLIELSKLHSRSGNRCHSMIRKGKISRRPNVSAKHEGSKDYKLCLCGRPFSSRQPLPLRRPCKPVTRGDTQIMPENNLAAINDSSRDTQRLLDLYRQQALASDRLARAAEDQATSARKSTESTSAVAIASRKTAAAADASTKLARQSLIISNAPLITLQDAALTQPLKTGEKVEITLRGTNTGRGPAVNLKFNLGVSFSSTRMAAGPPFEFGPPTDYASQLTLEAGSGSTNVIKRLDALPPEGMWAVQQGKLVIQVTGVAMYDDVFGQHYRQEVCNEYDYDPSGRKLGLEYCAHHNGPPQHLPSRPW